MRQFFIAVAAALALPAHADWTGKGAAGLVIASGNTEAQTANAKLQAAQRAPDLQ